MNKNSILVRGLLSLSIILSVFIPFYMIDKFIIGIFPEYKELISNTFFVLWMIFGSFVFAKIIPKVHKLFGMLNSQELIEEAEKIDIYAINKGLKIFFNIFIGIASVSVGFVFILKEMKVLNVEADNGLFYLISVIGLIISVSLFKILKFLIGKIKTSSGKSLKEEFQSF